MAVYITQIHLEGGRRLEHIAKARWWDGAKEGESSRQQMVEWIDGDGDARVRTSAGKVRVLVVRAQPPYLRSAPNETQLDNLCPCRSSDRASTSLFRQFDSSKEELYG